GGMPGALQLFRLDVDKSRLALAPTIDKTQAIALLQPQLRQELLAFYGTGPENVGGVGAASATTAGAASGGGVGAAGTTATTAATPAYPFDGAFPGTIFVGAITNTTNFLVTNNIATLTNLFPGATNAFVATNIFP